MKKILIVLTFLFSFTIGMAQSPIRSEGCGVVHYKNCDEKYLFETGFDNSNSRTNETKINILNELKKRIENKISEYSKTTSIDQNLSCAKISQTLWEGKQGKDLVPNFKEDVIILQNFLNNNLETGGSKLVVDGNFDKKLPERIKIFQRIHGISQTGAVGPLTLKKINSMVCLSSDKIQVSIQTPGESGLLGDKSKFEVNWNFANKYPKNSNLTLSLKRLSDGYEGYVWPYIGVSTQTGKGTFSLNCLYNCVHKPAQEMPKYKLVAKIVYCSNTNVTDMRFCENNINGVVTGDKPVVIDVSDKIENNPVYLQFIGSLKLENFQQ